jgi:UDPglucose 6-dehydrogenase
VQDVARGIGLDNRIGTKFLHAGPGYGGSCFPKDTLALIKTAQDHGSRCASSRRWPPSTTSASAPWPQGDRGLRRQVRGKTIALLGLTFKPNTDDMRDAPSIDIVTALQDAGAQVRAYDPEGMEQARLGAPGVAYADDAYACAEGPTRW